MIKPRKRLVDATVAALYVKSAFRVIVSASTVRSWATRGHIARYGDEEPGHFDLNEVDAYVRRRLANGTLRPDHG